MDWSVEFHQKSVEGQFDVGKMFEEAKPARNLSVIRKEERNTTRGGKTPEVLP